MSTRFKVELQYTLGGNKRSRWYDITNRLANRPKIKYQYEGTVWSYGVAVVSITKLVCENTDGLLSPEDDWRSVFSNGGMDGALLRVIYPTESYESVELNPDNTDIRFIADDQNPVFLGYLTSKVTAALTAQERVSIEVRSFEAIAKDVYPSEAVTGNSGNVDRKVLVDNLLNDLKDNLPLVVGVSYDPEFISSYEATYNNKLYGEDFTIEQMLNKILQVEDSVFYYDYNRKALIIHKRGLPPAPVELILDNYLQIKSRSDGSERIINQINYDYTPRLVEDANVAFSYNFSWRGGTRGLIATNGPNINSPWLNSHMVSFNGVYGIASMPRSLNSGNTWVSGYLIFTDNAVYPTDATVYPTHIKIGDTDYELYRRNYGTHSMFRTPEGREWDGGRFSSNLVTSQGVSKSINIKLSTGEYLSLAADEGITSSPPNPEEANRVERDEPNILAYRLSQIEVDATFLNNRDFRTRIIGEGDDYTGLLNELKDPNDRVVIEIDANQVNVPDYFWNLSGYVFLDINSDQDSRYVYGAAKSRIEAKTERLSVFDPRVIVDGSAVLFKTTIRDYGGAPTIINLIDARATTRPNRDTVGLWATESVTDSRRLYIANLRIRARLPQYGVLLRLDDSPDPPATGIPGLTPGHDLSSYYVTNARLCFRYRDRTYVTQLYGNDPYDIQVTDADGEAFLDLMFDDLIAGRIFPVDFAITNPLDAGIDSTDATVRIINTPMDKRLPAVYSGTRREVRT